MNKELNRIDEFLSRNNLTRDKISKQQLEQLILIDREIQKRINKNNELRKEFIHNKINVFSISSAIKISRKTFYNNLILKKFVDEYSNDNEKEIEKFKYDNILIKVGEYSRELKLLQEKDLDNELLKCENEKLQKQIKNLEDKIEFLEKTNANTQNAYKN